MPSTAETLLGEYVRRHDQGVKTGNFEPLSDLFAEDATIRFEGTPFGPLQGRAAILDGFRRHPPDDELVADAIRGDERSARCEYRWKKRLDILGGTLRIEIRGRFIVNLVVTAGNPP